MPTVAVTGFEPLGEGGILPNLKLSQTVQITDGLAVIRGAHNVKAGGDIRFIINNAFTPSATPGSFGFTGAYTQNPRSRTGTGSAVADLLLGTPNTANMTTPTIGDLRQRYYGFYVQDDSQASKKLTFNLGFRWDFNSPFWDRLNRVSNFIIEPGSPDFGKLVWSRGDSIPDRALVTLYKKDLAPRLGLAYRLPRNTVVRAAYGLFNSGTTLIGINGGRGRALLRRPGVVSALLGGWSVNGIVAVQSGRPFTPTLSVNTANAGGAQRPDRIAGGILAGGRTVNRWFDTAAFASPNGFAFGNSGRNILTGPRLRQVDFSLFKNFAIRENLRVQFRAESFNCVNHSNFDVPNAVIGTAAAGTVGNPRQNQFALKVLF